MVKRNVNVSPPKRLHAHGHDPSLTSNGAQRCTHLAELSKPPPTVAA
jgi:hypothetical protein